MKTKKFVKFLIFFFAPFVLAVPSCSDGDPSPELGTIVFASDQNFDFRIFDSAKRQVAQGSYKAENPKLLKRVTLPVGVYSVSIEADGLAPCIKSFTLTAGNVGFLFIVITIDETVNEREIVIHIDTNQ